MTVRELIEALKKMPPGDEAATVWADEVFPVEQVYHNSTHDQDYVVID